MIDAVSGSAIGVATSAARIGAPPRPWRFALLSMPYGAFNGVAIVALPYVLRQRGLSVEHIAALGALVQAPAIWFVLWAPAVDVRWRRRTWLLLLSLTSAALASVALARVESTSIRALTILFVAASAFNQPILTAIGGLVATTVPNALRGRTGGWSQAGILGSAMAAGGATLWVSQHASAMTTALTAGTLIAAPALSALGLDDPAPPPGRLGPHVSRIVRDVRHAFSRREAWIALLFFLSPIGASALTNLFSAVATEFHASARTVIVAVILAGLMMPIGALLGGLLCDRFDRWRVYPVAGLTSAASTGLMLLGPLAPGTYVVGAALYALTTGFCFAAFMALAFDLLGASTVASGTRFTVFTAAVNVPVVYMLRLDGMGYAHFGMRGMLGVDAASNASFGLLFLAAVLVWRRSGSTVA